MAADSPAKEEGLISFFDYLKGWLLLVWRLPAILHTRKQIAAVGTENRESWGCMLEENAAKFPDNPAIKSEEACLSYREYNTAVNRCANFFISKGMKKGDVACVCLENRPELLIVYSAMAKIGAVNSMINTNLRHDSLKHCLTLHPARIYIIGEVICEGSEENAELDACGLEFLLQDLGVDRPLHLEFPDGGPTGSRHAQDDQHRDRRDQGAGVAAAARLGRGGGFPG